MSAVTETHVGARRRGWNGRVGLFRGSVTRAGDGREVILTRSPELAIVIARFLNGGVIATREVDDPSPYRRYTTGRGARDPSLTEIYAAPSTGRHPSAFGDGTIARTDDSYLADRVAAMLNDTDPDHRRKATRGFGWW